MSLTDKQAAEIAALLNQRNQLTIPYSGAKVLASAERYLFRLSSAATVAAFVEVKKLQWYQAEILHLTVHASEEKKGHAKALLASAEEKARDLGARLMQCTIREDNEESRGLFTSRGYSQVSSFFNEASGKNVLVFQKVLSHAR